MTESFSVTENGTYEPTEGIDGYDRVMVNVPIITPDIEPLTVTANGTYTASGDGFNPVTVNVEAPKDPNVCEGEFEGTEAGVLTIDTGYEGDGFPKAIFIEDADGIVKTPKHRAYTVSAYSAVKSYADLEPDYTGETNVNQFRCQLIFPGSASYTSSSSSGAYIFSHDDPSMGNALLVKMPDNKTLKVYIVETASSSASRFQTGIRYKYKVFY